MAVCTADIAASAAVAVPMLMVPLETPSAPVVNAPIVTTI